MKKVNLVWLVLGLVLLGGVFWYFNPETGRLPADLTSESESVMQTQTKTPTETIEIKQGHRVSGPALIQLKQGDTIRLVFLSDASGELHLHGYDRTVHLHPSEPAELLLIADHSGRFEYELHQEDQTGHNALGVIEVIPQ